LPEQENSEDDVPKTFGTLLVAWGIGLGLSAAAYAADQTAQSPDGGTKPPKCLEAAVNPVTGYALCVNPVGAPVEQPPVADFKPCKPRAHDNEAWTTYEHWSGCGD
jgi:hypothetical protein